MRAGCAPLTTAPPSVVFHTHIRLLSALSEFCSRFFILSCRVLCLPDSFNWNKVEASGEVPPPRWRHTANAVDGNKLIVFGGFNSSHVRLNDLYVLDVKSMSWSQQGNPLAAKERRRKKQSDRTGGATSAAEEKSASDVTRKPAAATGKSDFLDDIDGCVASCCSWC